MKGLKMRVSEGKSAQKCRFCARGWLPRAQQRPLELSTTRHEPCGVHLAAVRQATDCRNLPRNLPPCIPPARLSPRNLLPRPTCRSYRRAYRRGTTAKSYRRVLPPGILPCIPPGNLPTGHTTARWVPRPAGGGFGCRRQRQGSR